MENRKKLGLASFILLIILTILFGSNKHSFILGDFILTKIGVSVWSNGSSGVRYTGVVTALLSIIAIFGIVRFRKDVHENFGKFVLLFFIVGSFIYPTTYDSVYGFVKSNLSGLSSIEYIRDRSQVSFESGNNTISFKGNVRLKNYSSETKEFYMKIPVDPDRDLYGDLKEIPVRNSSYEPIKFVIGPKGEVMFNVEAYVKQSDRINNCSGTMSPDIVIFNGTEEKRFLANTY